jgi:uncharacterized protein YejL (UPF0352 family)
MRKNLIILVILACLVSFSLQETQELTKEEKYFNCMKAEGFSHIAGWVLDVYYGKITTTEFMSKYLDWYIRTDVSFLKKCFPLVENKQLLLKSAFSKIGMTLLYASNCEKDLGPSFIVLDNVVSNLQNIKKEWKNALANTFTLGLVGFQSFKDCRSAVENIIDIWKQ